MNATKALLLLTVAAACACTRTVTEQGVLVTVKNLGNVAGIDRLRVYVSNPNDGKDNKVLSFGPASPDASIDFPKGVTSFSFSLPATREGTVDIVVEAQKRDQPLAFGWASTKIVPHDFARAEVSLLVGASLCGLVSDSSCDDHNHFSGDGCSFTCHREGVDGGTGRDATIDRADGRPDVVDRDAAPDNDGGSDGRKDVPDAAADLAPIPDVALSPDAPVDLAIDTTPIPDVGKDLAADIPWSELKGKRPCDLYALAGTPCVAAHSTVRALFSAYRGKLYRVRHEEDAQELDIGVVPATGLADEPSFNAFCAGFTCLTTLVYDQSEHGNDLQYQGPGSAVGGKGTPALSNAEPIRVGGQRVFSLYLHSDNAYWADGSNKGMPTGTEPLGVYMVTSGTHITDKCCFDYGNSKVSRKPEPAGSMNAIAFGKVCSWSIGCPAFGGPWVQADFENGIFSGGSKTWNPNQKSFDIRFVTAMLKNDGKDRFALKGGNATAGKLTTLYQGSLPEGFSPMRQQGAIVLGSDGNCCVDSANVIEGTFYEGAIVAGYPPDEADDAVQADLVAAGYSP